MQVVLRRSLCTFQRSPSSMLAAQQFNRLGDLYRQQSYGAVCSMWSRIAPLGIADDKICSLVLVCCTRTKALQVGEKVHNYIDQHQMLQVDVDNNNRMDKQYLAQTLIRLYNDCGAHKDAIAVTKSLIPKGLVTPSALRSVLGSINEEDQLSEIRQLVLKQLGVTDLIQKRTNNDIQRTQYDFSIYESTAFYEVFIDIYCRLTMIPTVKQLLMEMISLNLPITADVFVSLFKVQTFSKSHSLETLLPFYNYVFELFDSQLPEIKEHEARSVPLGVILFNEIFATIAFLKKGEEVALRYFHIMEQLRVHPSDDTYSYILKCFTTPEKSKVVLDSCLKTGGLTTKTCVALLELFVKCDDLESVLKVLQMMVSSGLHISPGIFVTISPLFCSQYYILTGDDEAIASVLEILSDNETAKLEFFDALITYHINNKSFQAFTLFGRLAKEKLNIPASIYVRLIKFCNATLSINHSHLLLDHLRKNPSVEWGPGIACSMIELLCNTNQLALAEDVFKKDITHPASDGVYNRMLQVYLKTPAMNKSKITKLIELMKVLNVTPVAETVEMLVKSKLNLKSSLSQSIILEAMRDVSLNDSFPTLIYALVESKKFEHAELICKNITVPANKQLLLLKAWDKILHGYAAEKDLVNMERVALFMIDKFSYPHISPYVILEQVYTELRKPELERKYKNLRLQIPTKTLKSKAVITIDGISHSFYHNDKLHPQIFEIYDYLHTLVKKMAEVDVQVTQNFHCVRLACVFGVMSMNAKKKKVERLLVMHNNTICSDCVTFLSALSKVCERTISLVAQGKAFEFTAGKMTQLGK